MTHSPTSLAVCQILTHSLGLTVVLSTCTTDELMTSAKLINERLELFLGDDDPRALAQADFLRSILDQIKLQISLRNPLT